MDRRDARKRIQERFFPDIFIPPKTALTLAVDGGGANLSVGKYLYAMTYVYPQGESDLSPIATITTVGTTDIDISSIPAGDRGLNIIARNIYRTVADGSEWFKVGRILDNDPATNTFDDGVTDVLLIDNHSLRTSIGDFSIDELNEWIDKYNKEVVEHTRCVTRTDSSISTVIGTASYTIPTNALIPLGRDIKIYYDNRELNNSTTTDLNHHHSGWRNAANGRPIRWYYEELQGPQFKLWPPPDEVQTLILEYPGRVPDIPADDEELLGGFYQEHHDVVLDGVSYELRRRLFDAVVAQGDLASYQLKLRDFKAKIENNRLKSDMRVRVPHLRYRTQFRHQSNDFFNRFAGGHF